MEPSVIIKARYGALSNHFHMCFVRRPNLRFHICVKTLSSNRRNMVLSLLRSYVSFILFKARVTNNFLADTMECVHEIKICLCHKYLLQKNCHVFVNSYNQDFILIKTLIEMLICFSFRFDIVTLGSAPDEKR